MKQDRPCSCTEHIIQAPTELGHGHVYHCQQRPDCWWIWVCECGASGRWQGQSPSVSYHQWLRHAERRENERRLEFQVKEPKRKPEKCRVCKKEVLIQIFKGTGICCVNCQKQEDKEKSC